VAFTTLIACLLGLINIGSSTAFNDVISLTVGGLYSSYLICSVLLLWRRCTGAIGETGDASRPSIAGDSPQLTWGPWKVPGRLGIAVNVFGIIYMTVILFFSFWPPATPTTAATMNYSVAVLGCVAIFCVVYYSVRARHVYKGPLVETGN